MFRKTRRMKVFEPTVCKNCLITSMCSKNMGDGTLCDAANKELREVIFSFNQKIPKKCRIVKPVVAPKHRTNKGD